MGNRTAGFCEELETLGISNRKVLIQGVRLEGRKSTRVVIECLDHVSLLLPRGSEGAVFS